MGEVAHLFICLVHRFPMKAVESVEAIENKGFRGCIHGRPGSKRQVCLMDKETLDKFKLAPGEIKENVTVRGIDFQKLGIGQELQLGGAKLEGAVTTDICGKNGRNPDGAARGIERTAGMVVPSDRDGNDSDGRQDRSA